MAEVSLQIIASASFGLLVGQGQIETEGARALYRGVERQRPQGEADAVGQG